MYVSIQCLIMASLLSPPSSLVPGTQYYYIFGDSSYGWSEGFSFRASPTPGPDVTTRVVAYGGMCGLLQFY